MVAVKEKEEKTRPDTLFYLDEEWREKKEAIKEQDFLISNNYVEIWIKFSDFNFVIPTIPKSAKI